MAFTPNSTVYLLDTPLDNTYKNQLRFADVDTQYAYFQSRIKHTFDGVTYQRKDDSIKVNADIDTLWDSNYVMYRNANAGNLSSYKWFYAFITKMVYISKDVTEIFIETDVYQTWLTETTLLPSFVVREHVRDDERGSNTIEENLELGEYTMVGYKKSGLLTDLAYIVGVSELPPFTGSETIGLVYNKLFSGLAYVAFDSAHSVYLKEFLKSYSTAGKIDAIALMFTVPKLFIHEEVTYDGMVLEDWNVSMVGQVWSYNGTYSNLGGTDDDVGGYTPKNKKLLCYPYNFLYVSNNQGNSAEYRFEDFRNLDITFSIYGNLSANCKAVCSPWYYKHSVRENWEHSISLSDFPLCSWNNDIFLAWLAQNKVDMAVSFGGGALAVGAGIATGNAMAVAGGALSIGRELGAVYKAKTQPDQARGNMLGGTFNSAFDTQDFFMCRMTVREGYAKKIDDYFTMFGYKVNTLKVPETHCRDNWNYIQTIDINIRGSIPDNDMRRLKQMYNEGVTLWHSASNFLDYSVTNDINI